MIEYIYFVKCPNCDDEPFDFFDEAKEFALGCLSNKPIITQTEVCRNDFGECTDSCDLGTIWSWEEMMKDIPADEPAISIFTTGYFDEYDPDTDEEFAALDNSLDSVPDNFRKPSDLNETYYAVIEVDGEERRFPFDTREEARAYTDYVRAGKDPGFKGKKIGSTYTESCKNPITENNAVLAATKAPKDADYVIVLKNPITGRHTFFGTNYRMTSDLNKAMTYPGKFTAEDDIKYAEDIAAQAATKETDYLSNRFFVTTVGEAKKLQGKFETKAQHRARLASTEAKPIPEDMTIDELVEALEENEDMVECKWCEDLFDKSECRYEVDLGWLCSRCEAAIKSRGETLTFRENNYWDFLNESDTSTESPLLNDEPQKKEYEWKKENVEFYYDNLEITITGAAHNEHPNYGTSGWYEPVWYDEYEVTKDYTYEVEPEEVAVRIYEDFLEEEDIEDVPGGFDALMDDDIFDQYMEKHFDDLVKKYYDKLLDYYEEYATEDCTEYYNSKELDDALGICVPDRED